MAGSRKWMVYTKDDLSLRAVQIDESNGEAANFADYDSTAAESNIPPLERDVTMRYVTVVEPSTGATRKIWVGTPSSGLITGVASSLLLWAFSGSSAGAAVAWLVTQFVGERISSRRPIATDTGFTDGDAT